MTTALGSFPDGLCLGCMALVPAPPAVQTFLDPLRFGAVAFAVVMLMEPAEVGVTLLVWLIPMTVVHPVAVLFQRHCRTAACASQKATARS